MLLSFQRINGRILVGTSIFLQVEYHTSFFLGAAIEQRVDDENGRTHKSKDDLQRKSQESTLGWAHTKEHKKKYC